MRLSLGVAILGAVLIGSAVTAAESPVASVEMRQETYVPDHLTVAPGTTVEWTNHDSMPHSVTADGKFDSGPIMPGKKFRWTVKEAGNVDYRCIFHPSMTASLTVAKP